MKKSVLKFTALFLTLVLAVGILPMAAFAQGEVHECDTENCASVSPMAIICKNHFLVAREYVTYEEYSANEHHVHECVKYTCNACGSSSIEEVSVYKETHEYETSGDYSYCAKCGHIKGS